LSRCRRDFRGISAPAGGISIASGCFVFSQMLFPRLPAASPLHCGRSVFLQMLFPRLPGGRRVLSGIGLD